MGSRWRFQCSYQSYDLGKRIYNLFGTGGWSVGDLRKHGLVDPTNMTSGYIQNMRNAKVIENYEGGVRQRKRGKLSTMWRITTVFKEHLEDRDYHIKRAPWVETR